MKLDKRWVPALVAPMVIAGVIALPPLAATAVDLPDLSPQEVILLMDSPVVAFEGSVTKVANLGLPAFEFSSMMTQDMVDTMSATMPEGMEELVPQVLEQNPLMDVISLLSGTHNARIYSSENAVRVQILDPLSQRDLVVTKDSIWMYDYKDAIAYTAAIPNLDTVKLEEELKTYSETEEFTKAKAEAEESASKYAAELGIDLSSPESIADYLVSKLEVYSTITVGQDHRVAGRTAYKLIMTPNSENTLVDSIQLSVDSETGMVLDLEVYSVEDSSPVFKLGFTNIKMGEPDASIFEFTPPSGTTVVDIQELISEYMPENTESYKAKLEEELKKLEAEYERADKDLIKEFNKPTEEELNAAAEAIRKELEALNLELPEVIGEGWDAVVRIPANSNADLVAINEKLAQFDITVEELMTEASTLGESLSGAMTILDDMFRQFGDNKVFSTPLLNVLITPSGDAYVGSVDLDYLSSLVK